MCTYSSCSVVLFFLAEMLRALYNVQGTIGGLMILPLIVGQTIALMLAGEFVVRTNLAWPLLVLGPFLTTIASFLMSTSTAKTPIAFPVGLSALTGIGTGIISQSVVILAQLQYKDDKDLIGAATGLAIFSNNLGRFLGAAIGSCIFGNAMIFQLSKQVPNLDKNLLDLVTHNAQSIWTQVPEVSRYATRKNFLMLIFFLPFQAIRPLVIQAYRVTLNDVFIVSACFGGLGVFSAFFAEWYRI